MRRYWICLGLAAILGCSDPRQIMSEKVMLETVHQQLAAENPDTDAAIILSQALEKARSTAPEEQSEILDRALRQAEEARGFSPHLEALLPDG